MVKQLKNRYNDTATNRKFILGINRAKMKVFDVKKEEIDPNVFVPKTNQFFDKQQTSNDKPQKKTDLDSWKF